MGARQLESTAWRSKEKKMAKKTWVTVGTKYCELLQRNVAFMEQRVYPTIDAPEVVGYRVLAEKCSDDIVCNMAGYPCRWAFTNPLVDRYVLG
jgi:hypothetical protein